MTDTTNTTRFTEKEIELFSSLVRLGDSKELAKETVLKQREKQNASDFYKSAYEN